MLNRLFVSSFLISPLNSRFDTCWSQRLVFHIYPLIAQFSAKKQSDHSNCTNGRPYLNIRESSLAAEISIGKQSRQRNQSVSLQLRRWWAHPTTRAIFETGQNTTPHDGWNWDGWFICMDFPRHATKSASRESHVQDPPLPLWAHEKKSEDEKTSWQLGNISA